MRAGENRRCLWGTRGFKRKGQGGGIIKKKRKSGTFEHYQSPVTPEGATAHPGLVDTDEWEGPTLALYRDERVV